MSKRMPSTWRGATASAPSGKHDPAVAAGLRARLGKLFNKSWPWLFCCVLGAQLSLSQLHRSQNADSLLASIISLTVWTPMAWRMNRYGQLWSLVCSVVHHPLWNVVAVMFCNVTAGLAAHFLLARLLLRQRGPWQWTGLLSIFLTLLLGSPRFVFESLSAYQFMTTPLAVGGVGIALLHSQLPKAVRTLGACAAFGVVAWYNPAAPVMLGAVLFWQLLLHAFELRGTNLNRKSVAAHFRGAELASLILAGLSTKLGLWMMRSSRWHMAAFDENLSIGAWMRSVGILTQKVFCHAGDQQYAPYLADAVVLLGVVVLLGAFFTKDPLAWQYVRQMSAGLLAAVTYGVAVSRNAWVKHEDYMVRYFMPVLFVAVVAVCVGFVGLMLVLSGRGHNHRWAAGARPLAHASAAQPAPGPAGQSHLLVTSAVLVTLLCGSVQLGLPSFRRVEGWFTDWMGGVGQELLDYEFTHVAGSYWQAWPAMLYANWKRYTVHDQRRVFAIAHRYDPTVPLMPRDVRTWRIGLLKESLQEAQGYVAGTGLRNLEVVGETPHLVVVRVRPGVP